MTACVAISWLRLEQYALGELEAVERIEIAGHLAACPRCQARADLIEKDARRELPPLPAGLAPAASPTAARRGAWFGLALAAAIAMLLVFRTPERVPQLAGRRIAVKGGEVTIELVRERGGSIGWEPTSFTLGDRFKLLLTCAPPLRVYADLVVVQGEGPAFPFAASLVSCGNRVPFSSAFRITGPGDATVCVAVDPAAPPPRDLQAGTQPGAGGSRACLHLDRE